MSSFHIVWLIWSVIGCGSKLSFAAADDGCSITMPIDLPKFEPVLIYAANDNAPYAIWRPNGEQNQLPVGSRLNLLCAGDGNLISSLNKQSVELVCRADGEFASVNGNKPYELKELGCSAIPTSDLLLTSKPCSNGQGYIYEAGFDYEDDFLSVFTICYNNATEHTYYTHNVLNGAAIDYKVIEGTRRAFRSNGMRFTTTATNKFYAIKNQVERFEKHFGKLQPFITKTSYLARGHMTPDADFVFSFEQLATYFYANVAPEFQVVNSGNWIRVENLARNLASSLESDLDIYTGTIGHLQLSHRNKKNVPMYVDHDELIEVPEYYFKVIKHEPTDAAIVMITLNNPFASLDDVKELCPNVCKRAQVSDPIFTDTKRGYTYCCELSAFKKIYDDLPSDLTASKLLNETPVQAKSPAVKTPAVKTPARKSPSVKTPAEKTEQTSNTATSKDGCAITLPTDIPKYEPVYFIKTPAQPNPILFRPAGQVTVLPKGSELTLACIGHGNNLEALGQQSIELTCRGDGTFYSSEKSKPYTLSQLNCTSIPASELEPTSKTCGGSKTAFEYEAGFPWGNYYGTVFTLCYDSSTGKTLYARNIINGATINYSITESSRRAFRANGMHLTTAAVNRYYTQKTQVERFENYFGNKQSYIDKKSFLARGHMAPDADFVFRYEQMATYFYANVAPEFQAVNAGNWLRVESATRNLAAKFNSDLLAFTGTIGVLQLPKSNGKMQEIYADKDNLFPAPEYYYKVLMHPQLTESVVMISLNNPFAKKNDIKEFCPNVCADFGLDSPAYKNIDRGYTFCCTLRAFQQAVPDLPTFDLPKSW